ncbi:MAG: hypothetical protein FWE82_06415 [Defluviitaleaceae bacterium]|nr:hypothetical protein [Defluviitaleaceae bacterium]
MADNKKEQERAELHRTIWSIANDLRGSVDGYMARLVPGGEIAAQDFNLSISSYVAREDTREIVNIAELNAEIERIVARTNELRKGIGEIVAEIEGDAK